MKSLKEHTKATGYKTPPKYFEEFTLSLHKKCLENPLSKVTSSKSGYVVPDAYLDAFQISEAQLQKQHNSIKVIAFLKSKTIPVIYGAAAIILILLSLSIFIKNSNAISLDAVTTDSYHAYLTQETIDPLLIGEVFKEELNEVDLLTNDSETEQLLLDYLKDEDTYNLIEEL